ncbi:hypothetical protein [Fusobacterium gastrosuis]|uniref:hypothetical protein n=1 Tax=Fusobacterium gastrosuis TaxID=1755100 RepID=UPI002A94F36A|nr:hypothetical protein [Fusobacterium gastrosuis]
MKKVTLVAVFLSLVIIGCGKEKVEEVKDVAKQTIEASKDATNNVVEGAKEATTSVIEETKDVTVEAKDSAEKVVEDGKSIASEALKTVNSVVDSTKNTISLNDEAKEVTVKTLEEGKEFGKIAGKTSNQALQASNKIVDSNKTTISLNDSTKEVTEKALEEGKELGTLATKATKKIFSKTESGVLPNSNINNSMPISPDSSSTLKEKITNVANVTHDSTEKFTTEKTSKEIITKNIKVSPNKVNSDISVSNNTKNVNTATTLNTSEEHLENSKHEIKKDNLLETDNNSQKVLTPNTNVSPSKELKFKNENNEEFSVEFVGAYAVLKTAKGEGFILSSSVTPEGVRYYDDKGHELFFTYQLNNIYLNGMSIIPILSDF